MFAQFFKGCSSIVDLVSYLFGTSVKKAEPTNSQPLPMKSEVRALKKDTKIDPKSDKNLDKKGVLIFIHFLMLFDRFRLRFWLHFGTQNAPKNESKKQLNFQPILGGFWSILGASRAPLGDHFGLQKSMKKHSSSKDPSMDAQWTPKGSKIKQNGPLRLPK